MVWEGDDLQVIKELLDKIMSLRREDTMVVIILMGRPVSVCSHVDRGRGGSLPMAGPLDGIAFKVGSKCSISLNVFFRTIFFYFFSLFQVDYQPVHPALREALKVL